MSEPIGASTPRASTWDLLRVLGFVEDRTVVSDVMPGLSFNFGNFKLSASACVNLRVRQVVLLTGVIATRREVCEVQCELPREVESAEQGMAWLVWCLDNAVGGRFEPAVTPGWLAEGRRHFHLLPWECESAAYAARPHCVVNRDWVHVALKALGEQLTTVDDEAAVTFGFDGNVLTISCAGKVSPMPAEGSPWPQPYSVRAGSLRNLPKRLMQRYIEFSLWDGALRIGNRASRPVFAINPAEGP
jgi:hypothetical protein